MIRPTMIEIPTPALGAKCWLLEGKGLFCLERGAGMLGTIACTHAGSGGIRVYDGVPDENGYFPKFEGDENSPEYDYRPGRQIYVAIPAVMGSWWINGGFFHGLTIEATGGTASVSMIASIVWSKVRQRAAP